MLSGIRERAGNALKVLYHEGCKITIGGSWQQDEVVPSDPEEDRKSIAEAVKVAQQADVIVLDTRFTAETTGCSGACSFN